MQEQNEGTRPDIEGNANLVITLKDEDTGAECKTKLSVLKDESDMVKRSVLIAAHGLVEKLYGKQNGGESGETKAGLGVAEAK